MIKQSRRIKHATADIRYLGSQDEFLFSLAKSRKRGLLNVFIVKETEEVIAAVSSEARPLTPEKFLETSVLPIYERRKRKLRYIQRGIGPNKKDRNYQKLLKREGISQVYCSPFMKTPCEFFALAFQAKFCRMRTTNRFYRSAEDLQSDFSDWLDEFNLHHRSALAARI